MENPIQVQANMEIKTIKIRSLEPTPNSTDVIVLVEITLEDTVMDILTAMDCHCLQMI